jgi:hypothetical protein
MVPAVAAIAVAMALPRNRLFTSLQLLPGLLIDRSAPAAVRWVTAPRSTPIRWERSAWSRSRWGSFWPDTYSGPWCLARRATVQQPQPGMVVLAVSVTATMAAVTAAQA